MTVTKQSSRTFCSFATRANVGRSMQSSKTHTRELWRAIRQGGPCWKNPGDHFRCANWGTHRYASVAEAVLSISGEDPQTVQRKFRSAWHGTLHIRYVILMNELPRITDVSGALASRVVVLVLTQSFDGTEDRGLYDTLVTELPGMLNWSLEGRDRLDKRGYFIQPDSGNERLQQFDDLASPESAMLRDCTEMKPGGILLQGDLFQVGNAGVAKMASRIPEPSQTFVDTFIPHCHGLMWRELW